MPRLKELKTNFVSGELDALLKGRSDVKHYFNGAEFARNVVIIPQGGARTRPGSRYLWTVPEVSAGVASNVRLCTFQFSTEQTYLFVFHHLLLTIFRHGVQVAQIATPWASSDLVGSTTAQGDLISSGISWTQSIDTLFVFHENFAPQQIKRTGSHSSWALTEPVLKNLPRFAFGGTTYVNGVDEIQEVDFPSPGDQGNWANGDTFTLTLEDEETDNIRYDDDSAVLRARMEAALKALPNVVPAGVAVTTTGSGDSDNDDAIPKRLFIITFSGANGGRPWGAVGYTPKSTEEVPSLNIFVTTKGVYPGEDVWSVGRGYPRCGVFFQGRLWLAGSKSLPNTVWASRSGDPLDFNNKRLADDYGIQATTDTDDVPAFFAIYAGRHLQLFSTAGEFYIPASENEGVTPANIVLRRTTSRGAKPGLRVYEVDGATIFVQRRGQALREFIFADTEQAYQANNISLLFSHLMRNPVGITLRRSSSTDDADFVFLPNSDGTMTTFCTLRTQEVNAASLWSTKGSWIDAAAVLEDVYFCCRRTVGGSVKTFIEVMDATIVQDCAIVGGAGSSLSAAHLPNTTLSVVLDGSGLPDQTSNGAGLVTFTRAAEARSIIGLGWPEVMPEIYPGLRWLLKTLPIETQLSDGTMVGRKRRIQQLTLRLHETTGLIANGNRMAFRSFGEGLLDEPPPAYTGLKKLRGLLGWSDEGAVVLGDDRTSKATILALAWAVAV